MDVAAVETFLRTTVAAFAAKVAAAVAQIPNVLAQPAPTPANLTRMIQVHAWPTAAGHRAFSVRGLAPERSDLMNPRKSNRC